MILENYYQIVNRQVLVSRQQASQFAKQIANDFNPLHDVDAKRFCVPGDLLFGVILDQYGLSQQMRFIFSGMVGDEISLNFPDSQAEEITITDDNGKEYLKVERKGEHTTDKALIHALIEVYVAFSGRAFPHILVPLMETHGVMINPARPLIIYESMALHLQHLNFKTPRLELSDAQLQVKGKRGDAQLLFTIEENGQVVGHGTKNMLMSGLRPYDAKQMQEVVENYRQRQQNYSSTRL